MRKFYSNILLFCITLFIVVMIIEQRLSVNTKTDIDLKLTKIACSDLAQKEFVAWIPDFIDGHPSGGMKITTAGKEVLQTTYNPEWIEKQEKEKQADVNLRTWSTRGTKVAIVFGGLGFFLSLIAIYISLQK